ncbi:hypothetical protein GCM10009633_05230 [Janibacter melonis]
MCRRTYSTKTIPETAIMIFRPMVERVTPRCAGACVVEEATASRYPDVSGLTDPVTPVAV